MNVSKINQNNLFGVVELDSAGTIVYSNFEKEDETEISEDVTGLNFYDEVAPFNNADELRNRIKTFNSGSSATAVLEFICKFEDGFLLVRILLAKVNDKSSVADKNFTLVQIKTA